jgi:hypothetical protein
LRFSGAGTYYQGVKMTRKIKGLGLAFVAIAAMSMVAVSAAQASEVHATTAATSVSAFAQQLTQNVFITNAGSVKCTQATLEGTVNDQGQSAEQLTAIEGTATATYATCQAFGQAAAIDMNGCKFTFTNNNGAQPPVTTALRAYIDITGCTTGKSIEVTPQLNCVLTVPEQHNLGHVGFTNEGTAPNEDVKLTATVTGIKYQSHEECPSMIPTETRTDGQFTGTTTLQAREDLIPQQVTLHKHQYSKLSQAGNLIGLLAT